MIDAERYLNGDSLLRPVAKALYDSAKQLPLVSPHGHVDPLLFSEENYHFGNPVELLIQPDHYVLRILHSQGVSYEQLGIPARGKEPVEKDPRKIWQTFAKYFYCYAATPIGLWLNDELANVFGIEEKLTPANAQAIYDAIQNQLLEPEFTPRKLYQRFNMAVLSTTDSPTDDLQQHRAIANSGWEGHILPTFRADSILHIDRSDWRQEIEKLAVASGIPVNDFASYIKAVENRRTWFKQNGATATDLAVVAAHTALLSPFEMNSLLQKGLKGTITPSEAQQFVAGMLVELARMSAEDGLVMQMHVGCYRNHDQELFENSGPDLGADFPVPVEFTRPLQALLNRYGNHPNFNLILFTMDESTYARELAPLASYYPAVKLGPPWWFNDNLNGIQRFFEQAIDSGGLYNTAGFNDDTRALLSIPARHDLWRRASANWLAGLLVRRIIDENTAYEMIKALACGLAVKAYRLEKYLPAEARLS
jgi:glucuronate isomerase